MVFSIMLFLFRFGYHGVLCCFVLTVLVALTHCWIVLISRCIYWSRCTTYPSLENQGNFYYIPVFTNTFILSTHHVLTHPEYAYSTHKP